MKEIKKNTTNKKNVKNKNKKNNNTLNKKNIIVKKTNTSNRKNSKTKTGNKTKKNNYNNSVKLKNVQKNEQLLEIDNEKNKVVKKDKREKKKIIVILICLLIIMIISFISIFVIYPKIKENKEINDLKDEIEDILNGNEDTSIINENITTGKRKEVEEKIELYLQDKLTIDKSINEIKNDDNINNLLSIKSINNDLGYLEEREEELKKYKEDIEFLKDNYSSYKNDDKKIEKLYYELFDYINSYDNSIVIDKLLYNIEINKPIIKYLQDNKNYYDINDNKIIFNKRKIKDDYDLLVKNLDNNNIITELINDTEAPSITASDITLYKGNSVNLKDKVKCVDKVDDVVDCSISGTYDKDKVGTYKITITSVDKSNNKSSKTIKVTVKEKNTNKRVNTGNKPYYIEVIRNQNVVIVYGLDNNKEYNKIVKVFTVSVGRNGKTPTGTYKTTKGYAWGALINNVWGQYTTRITGSYLFHSVPYYSKNKGDLEWEEYNKLGTSASAGCVRMTVKDVKWIYDNIENGTTVKIYDGQLPNGVKKPSTIKINGSSPNKGWDPTDPDPNNPWKK